MQLGTIIMGFTMAAMVFAVGAAASWWTLLLTVPVAVGAVAVARAHEAKQSAEKRRRRHLGERGIVAEATVLRLVPTGAASATRVRVELRLEVQPADGERFAVDVEHSARHVDLPRIQVGAVIPVRYDPQDHGVVMVALEP
jgi:hypothetical protein